MKFKWWFPFFPIIGILTDSLYSTHTGIWAPLDVRIVRVIGVLAATMALLAVVQPWKEDQQS